MQKTNGLKESTITTYRLNLEPMNGFKPLEKWKKDDAVKYILKLQETSKPSTVENAKIIMKLYFKWLGKPEIVADIKIKTIKNSLKREDILTVEDVNKLIESTPSTLYKSLIAFLFESGCRINEALAIKVKDIQETDRGMIISIPQTKTGNDYRRILCPFSSGYIRNHITYNALDPDNKLFYLSDVAAWKHLRQIGEKSGIGKPVSPHKFRHAQATDMVLRGYQDGIINKKLGWTNDSKAAARYKHIADEDVINATADMAGTDIPKPVLANLKQAEALKIADASLQLSKLNEENAELRELIEAGKNTWEDLQAEAYQKDKELEAMELRLKNMESMLHNPALILAVADGLKAKMGKVK
jgi:integrase/recombinase XerD